MEVALKPQCGVIGHFELETEEPTGVSDGDGDRAGRCTLDEDKGLDVAADDNSSVPPEELIARRWGVGVVLGDGIHIVRGKAGWGGDLPVSHPGYELINAGFIANDAECGMVDEPTGSILGEYVQKFHATVGSSPMFVRLSGVTDENSTDAGRDDARAGGRGRWGREWMRPRRVSHVGGFNAGRGLNIYAGLRRIQQIV